MCDVDEDSIAKDVVVLSPQNLVDIMARIHEVPGNRDLKRQFSNEFEKLKAEGRVACRLLDHVWKDKAEDADLLIELLSRFKLIYLLEDGQETLSRATESRKEFIIPCMLKDKSNESFNKRWFKTCDEWKYLTEKEYQIVFDFGNFLPPPLFDYFMVHVYRHSSKTKGMRPILQRRAGIFSFSNEFLFCTRLVLTDCQIWVHARFVIFWVDTTALFSTGLLEYST